MIQKMLFGRTGHESTRTIFGAAAFSNVTQDEADRTLEVLLSHGVNHIDTAASYGDSELRIGPWMREHRKDFFLATKTGERTYEKARDQFHRSLDRLRVDSVDMIQLHYLVDPQEWEVALGPRGALEALIEAREQRLVRYIGVTGHDLTVPRMHLRSLARFDFDAVLLPYNFMVMQNPQYTADFNELVTLCHQRNVAVQTIKSLAKGPWGEKVHTHATWYQPLTDQGEIDTAVAFVLSRPGIFLNTTGDIHALPKVLDAAERYRADTSEEQAREAASRLPLEPLFLH